MGKVLALDVGEKTIGVATSDDSGTLAFPGTTIRRQEGYRRDMAAIRQLVEATGAAEVVVGYPLMMDGTRGIQAEKAENFAGKLRRFVSVPVVLSDERLSTWEADLLLAEAGRRADTRKQVIDSVAASLILQAYLDRKRSTAG